MTGGKSEAECQLKVSHSLETRGGGWNEDWDWNYHALLLEDNDGDENKSYTVMVMMMTVSMTVMAMMMTGTMKVIGMEMIVKEKNDDEDGSHTVPVGCWLATGVNEGVEIFMDSSSSSSPSSSSSSSLSSPSYSYSFKTSILLLIITMLNIQMLTIWGKICIGFPRWKPEIRKRWLDCKETNFDQEKYFDSSPGIRAAASKVV